MTKINLEKILEKDFGNNILSIREFLKIIKERRKHKIRQSIFLEEIKKY